MKKPKTRQRVAVLGAGIMGCCMALELARRGFSVDLFDLENEPMSGASRWNEGKIHLGYLYAADKTFATAQQLIPGGLAFTPLISSLIEQPLQDHATKADDIFLIHRNSVVPADQARHYYQQVDKLVRECVDTRSYLSDASHANTRQLGHSDLAAIANPDLAVAGFAVPERSVQTNWLADQLCAAVAAEPAINLQMCEKVMAARPVDGINGTWQVTTMEQKARYDYVVNALWHGRVDIDRSAGLQPPVEWSNRYRLSLFVRTRSAVNTASAVLAVGPYGDIKNYNHRDFYLSWYPAGLVYTVENESPDLELPARTTASDETVAAIGNGLASAFTGVKAILDHAEEVVLGGGYVFAQGRGSLASTTSTLHRRDRIGVVRYGNYYSIDTGKYSLAPWLAQSVAEELAS